METLLVASAVLDCGAVAGCDRRAGKILPGNDGLKVPNGRADKPVGSRQAAVRGSSDESQ